MTSSAGFTTALQSVGDSPWKTVAGGQAPSYPRQEAIDSRGIYPRSWHRPPNCRAPSAVRRLLGDDFKTAKHIRLGNEVRIYA